MKRLIIALLTVGLCAASLTACDELDLGGLAGGTDTDASTVTEATEDTSEENDDSATEDTSGETDDSATEDTSGGNDNSASEDTSGGNDNSASGSTTTEGNTNQEPEDDRLPAIDNVGTEHLTGDPITEREWEKIVMAKYDNYSYKWTVTQGGVTRVSYGCVDGRRWIERVFEGDVEIERRGEFSVGDSLLYHSYDFTDNMWVQENVGRTFNHPLNGVPFAFSDFTFDEATGTYTYRVPTDKTYTDEQIAAGAGTVALRFIDGECVYLATVDTDEAGNLNRMSFEFWSYGTTQVLTPETINPDAVLPPENNGDSFDGTVDTAPTMPDHNENAKPDHPDQNGDAGKLPPDHSADSGVHTESSPVPPEDMPMEDAKVESAPEAVLPPPPPDDEAVSNKPHEPNEPSADEDEWLDLNGNGIPDAKE